jgi:hypothetical protein
MTYLIFFATFFCIKTLKIIQKVLKMKIDKSICTIPLIIWHNKSSSLFRLIRYTRIYLLYLSEKLVLILFLIVIYHFSSMILSIHSTLISTSTIRYRTNTIFLVIFYYFYKSLYIVQQFQTISWYLRLKCENFFFD